MSYNIYSHALKEEIALLALQGTPTKELMKQYGVSYTSILNWKKQYIEKQAQGAEHPKASSEPACARCRVNMKGQYRTRMRELRIERDLSQTEVGKILDMSQSAYARYERGEVEIPIRNLIKLCHYYGVSFDYMLCLTNTRNYKKK